MSTAHYSQAVEQIGDAAGQVWHYLSENGPTALSRLAKDVDIPRDVLMQAIGWLAHEDKIAIDADSRTQDRFAALKAASENEPGQGAGIK